MEAAQTIRNAVARVGELREAQAARPGLREAVIGIKALQARRFSGTYEDIMARGPYSAAATFFLEELYSERDFAERDAQFARIAGAIERFFPSQVAQTAVNLASLHALTEALDHGMGVAWLGLDASLPEAARYIAAWREVGKRPEREAQLSDVLAIGREMARLTRTPGLRTMLRMMRGPAHAAGLASLQGFLEAGFDTFASMARGDGARTFLGIIEERESRLIADLFDAPAVACETQLARTLGQAP
ncbi:FFLEELY motif protein [Ramlibacter sp. PS4R-6]|uniref:FFLEELY motif protein n=1 Tax=Ramlibacter sp. PS4R-6 TaxID=3133438 RepID=UPI0030A2AF67